MNTAALYFAVLRVPDDRLIAELPYVPDAETAIAAVHAAVARGVALRGYVVRHLLRRGRIAEAKVVRVDAGTHTGADIEAATHYNMFLVEP